VIDRSGWEINHGSAGPMTHEQFVNSDAQAIFERMAQSMIRSLLRPCLYVVHNDEDLDRLPPCRGVYIAFSETGKCFYVGESNCVGRRVMGYGQRCELSGAKYIGFISCYDEVTQLATEKAWMGILRGQNNGELKPRNRDSKANYADLTWNPETRRWSINGMWAEIDRNGNVVPIWPH
jgi:hypothetical protein